MDINQMRERISESFCSIEGHELWNDILQDTSPNNYGFEVDYVDVAMNDIWVDIPNRTFTFKDLTLQFTAQMGASNPEHGYSEDFEFTLSGEGHFEFKAGGQGLEINSICVNETLDLYADRDEDDE